MPPEPGEAAAGICALQQHGYILFILTYSMAAGAGDTGLLDHLLKHLADKVVTAEGDKLRRRHNAEGHMEYWLQSSINAHTGRLPPSLIACKV